MDYKAAELPPEAVDRLRQYEQSLSSATGEEIVLVAYRKTGDDLIVWKDEETSNRYFVTRPD